MMFDTSTPVRSNDRVLALSPKEGLSPKSSIGLIDRRLFTGEQKLHVKMDPETCLWYFQYSNNGNLPEGLKGRYTGFGAAIKFAEAYFATRNINVTQVKD